MNNNIKLSSETKNKLKVKLDSVDSIINGNVNQLVEVMTMANHLSGNPEIYNIVTMLDQITINKTGVNKTIHDFSEKMDLNLQQIIDLDQDLANKFTGWD